MSYNEKLAQIREQENRLPKENLSPIGTVKIVDVPLEVDGEIQTWKVKGLSYAKKMEIAKVLKKMKDGKKLSELQPENIEISGDMAMDMLQYQFDLLYTNIVGTPDGTPVTKEYVNDLTEPVVKGLLAVIAPDVSVTVKK